MPTLEVIMDGNAPVVRETGRPLKLHAGDFFGELALRRELPRSADVIATDDVTALAIGPTAFDVRDPQDGRRPRRGESSTT